MKNILIIILAFTLLLAFDAFAGGGKRTGTGGASHLLIPVGPRIYRYRISVLESGWCS
jgi:hypothetical protein